jgi:hypothetical protein
MHRSEPDLCHHHALLIDLFITYSPSFFLAALFALGFASSLDGATTFLLATLFNLDLIFFFSLELPKEPMVLFPFFVFLSPLPIKYFKMCGNNSKGINIYQIHLTYLAQKCFNIEIEEIKPYLSWPEFQHT